MTESFRFIIVLKTLIEYMQSELIKIIPLKVYAPAQSWSVELLTLGNDPI